MIPNFVIATVLGLLLCATAVTLWLDARERRMQRQLAIALQTAPTASLPSIRRAETGSRSLLLHRLVNYNPDVVYAWHPIYVLLAAVLAACAVFYVNRLFEFSGTHVSIAAAIVAFLVMRGLFGWQRRRFAD